MEPTKYLGAIYHCNIEEKSSITQSIGINVSKEESNDQDSIQSSTTPDQGHHMGK